MNYKDNNIKKIQEKLMHNLDRLDDSNANLKDEVARSNSISQLANTYIKTCNLILRIEGSKKGIKSKIKEVMKNEK